MALVSFTNYPPSLLSQLIPINAKTNIPTSFNIEFSDLENDNVKIRLETTNIELYNAFQISQNNLTYTISFTSPDSSVGINNILMIFYDGFHQITPSTTTFDIIIEKLQGPYFSEDPQDQNIFAGQRTFYQLPEILNYNGERILLFIVDSNATFPEWILLQNTTLQMFPLCELLTNKTSMSIMMNITLSAYVSKAITLNVEK